MARPKSKNPRTHRVAVMLTDEENEILEKIVNWHNCDRAEALRTSMQYMYVIMKGKCREKNASYNREQ